MTNIDTQKSATILAFKVPEGSNFIDMKNEDNVVIFKITSKGEFIWGEAVTPDEAAKIMAHHFAKYFKELMGIQ